MYNLGLSKTFLSWLINNLSDRHHFVQIDNNTSNSKEVTFGVSQGSNLGPAIFNLYVSDLLEKILCKCIQYADDTTVYIHPKVSDFRILVPKWCVLLEILATIQIFKLQLHTISSYNLRSSCAPSLVVAKVTNTFQDLSAISNNMLPPDIRNMSFYTSQSSHK